MMLLAEQQRQQSIMLGEPPPQRMLGESHQQMMMMHASLGDQHQKQQPGLTAMPVAQQQPGLMTAAPVMQQQIMLDELSRPSMAFGLPPLPLEMEPSSPGATLQQSPIGTFATSGVTAAWGASPFSLAGYANSSGLARGGAGPSAQMRMSLSRNAFSSNALELLARDAEADTSIAAGGPERVHEAGTALASAAEVGKVAGESAEIACEIADRVAAHHERTERMRASMRATKLKGLQMSMQAAETIKHR